MKTRDLVYQETDNSCAFCGIRDKRVLTKHHLIPSKPANYSYDNLIILCHNCHHLRTANKGPSDDDLHRIKRNLIIKTLTYPGLNALKIALRNGAVCAMPFLVYHLIELGYIEFKEDSITATSDEIEDLTSELSLLSWYAITKAGRTLMEKWDL